MKDSSHFQFAFRATPMPRRNPSPLSSRRQPQQARSTDLVAAILEAAVQVLAKEGARGFTTTRVAERAGVSVGSVYQYFPNKASILFRLQSDEWRQTNEMLSGILEDRSTSPSDRLRRLVVAFVRSECEEAAVRMALSDAAPLYRDAPEAREARQAGERALQAFMKEAAPKVSEGRRALAGALITTTLSKVGKHVSESRRTATEIAAYCEALGDMLCAYLGSLVPEARPKPKPRSAASR